MQLLCSAVAYCRVNRVFELPKLLIRHKRKNCSSEAAAVDAGGPFAAKQFPTQRQRESHLLMSCCAERRYVLQEFPRCIARFIDVVQERCKIVVLQRPPCKGRLRQSSM